MIQTTAPTLAASAPQTAGMPASNVLGMPGADFAALLGLTSEVQNSATPEHTLHTGGVSIEGPSRISLPEVISSTQQGLVALSLQAGAAVSRPVESATRNGFDLAAPIVQGSVELPAPIAVKPGNPALPATSPVALAVAFVSADGAVGPALRLTRTAPTNGNPDGPTTPPASMPKAGPPGTDLPAPPAAFIETAVPSGGKDGKGAGKILPSHGLPPRHKPEAAIADAEPAPVPIEPSAIGQVMVAAVTAAPIVVEPLPAAPMALAIAPQPVPVANALPLRPATAVPMPGLPARMQPDAARMTAPLARDAEATSAAPVSSAASAQVRAVRFEPIEIVALDTPESTPRQAPAFVVKTTAPASAPAVSYDAPLPATVGVPIDAHVPAVATAPAPAAPVTPPFESVTLAPSTVAAVLPEPAPAAAAPSVAQAPVDRPSVAPLPARVTADHGSVAAPQQMVAASGMPTPIVRDTEGQVLPADPRAEGSMKLSGAAPAEGEARGAKAVEDEIAPITAHSAPHPSAPPMKVDAPPVSTVTAADGSSVPAPTRVDAPQDFDTLVSRLAEAREAAAPNVVRTAMAHGEFGRVSMQLDHSDGGLSVTLASRDPEFTGAVQAAAAAMAGNGSPGGDQPRQDGSAAQQNNAHSQTQAQSGPQTNTASQGQQARADASGQQSRREGGGFARPQDQQQPGTPGRNRGEQRSDGSGVYA
jgi:hypothetical protein